MAAVAKVASEAAASEAAMVATEVVTVVDTEAVVGAKEVVL